MPVEATSRASAYLRPPSYSLWCWSKDGQVLTWQDGTTIAFQAEVVQVLELLAAGGLPPFGALVLLLGACRDGWSSRGLQADHRSEQRLRCLLRVQELPAPLRTGSRARAVLAEQVLARCPHRLPSGESRLILEGLSRGGIFQPGVLAADLQQQDRTDRDLRLLRAGLEELDPEALQLRVRTGLDRLVEPAPVASPDGDLVRQLLAALRGDAQLGALASLALDLMAAVHMPRPVSVPEELPVGGVSDIAPRGPLDRLLASELAHDNDTLSARIALGEALYLRRETPPRAPRGTRLVLLDCGIRLWGVPRVFAAAVGLALAATSRRQELVTVYRAAGSTLLPVELTTREGLIELLEALEPAPHPGAALREFRRAVQAVQGHADAILVTHADALADPGLRDELTELSPLLVATVHGDGTYRLLATSRHGPRILNQARLSLADLQAPSGRISPPIRPLEAELPLILATTPFPLLLPHQVDPARSVFSEQHGVITLTRDGRVLHFPRRDRGGHQLCATMPRGAVCWVHLDRDQALVLGGSRGADRLPLLRVELTTGACSSAHVHAAFDRYQAAWIAAGLLHLCLREVVLAVDPTTGDPVGTLHLPPGTRHAGSRYLYATATREWFTAASDGIAPRLIPLPRAGSQDPVVAVFDREGHEGAWAVTRQGYIHATADGEIAYAPPEGDWQLDLQAHSRDGHRLVLAGHEGEQPVQLLVDLESGDHRRTHRPQETPWWWLEPHLLRHVSPPGNLRRRFDGILVDHQGRLTLRSVKGYTLHLTLQEPADELHLVRHPPEASGSGAVRLFEPASRPPGAGYDLRVARWPDGSRAWLDSRGLLHLQSATSGLPEITLVLRDGPMAGWSSEGRMCGPAYFCGEHPTIAAQLFHHGIRHFLAGL